MNAAELLDQARVATLGTIRPDGTTHLVPCVYACSGNQIITAIDHKPKNSRRLARLQNIAHDDRVSLLAHHYEQDWENLWWVRADGRARVVTAPPRMLDVLVEKYNQYNDNPPEGPYILIEIDKLTSWEAKA